MTWVKGKRNQYLFEVDAKMSSLVRAELDAHNLSTSEFINILLKRYFKEKKEQDVDSSV